jgi:dipeptidyl aminopeptidase/acylaminoacyl peptidase
MPLRNTLSTLVLILMALALGGCSAKPHAGPEEVPPVSVATPPKGPLSEPNGASAGTNANVEAAAPAPGEAAVRVSQIKLIERQTLFGNPDKSSARVSPDGKQLAYLAPRDGVMNIFVGPLDDPDAAKAVTEDKQRGIRAFFWAYDSQNVLYVQDSKGDEDWHLYRVELSKNETRDLTPIPKVNSQILAVSEKFPGEILVGLNDRDPQRHDVYRIDIASGQRKLVEKNLDFAGFVCDDDFRVRLASRMTPDGGNLYLEPDGKGGWKEFLKVSMEDTLTTSPVGFDKTGQKLFMTDSRGRNTAALVQLELDGGALRVLASEDLADAGATMVHPTEKNLQAVAFNYERQQWRILDPAIEEDMKHLGGVDAGELSVASRSLDDKIWIVAYIHDDGPVRYYRYDRPTKQTKFLFTNRKSLEGLPLAKMDSLVIKSRDGMNLVSYLTLPKNVELIATGRPKQPLPLVLLVHGGPWGRDTWGFDTEHQLLANRGYAVLSVNYRGSTGFGKQFTNAGNKEWAAKMHDDLIDAVNWAVHENIADPQRVAIMGGSYGGYATLVGLTFTPEVFACGVDIVGPSNLLTLLSTIPPYWAPMMQLFKDRVGDPTSDDGKAFLTERSPISRVERICRPLLIGQGANDPRVKQAESDQIVEAMQTKKIPVTYLLFPDEGHGFARPENNLAFYAVAEGFLARQLGGRAETIGNAFAGSTITCPEGDDEIPGLADALKQQTAK